MKKLFLSLCAISILATSCTKKDCWLCVATTTITVGDATTMTYAGQNICDMSEAQRAAHERKYTFSRTTRTAVIKQITTCKRLYNY